MRKDQLIKFRATQQEKELIQERAKKSGVSVSEYLLSVVKRKRIVVINELPKLMADIYGAAVNINQIAKVANTQKYVNKQNVEDLFAEAEILKKKVDEIIDCIVQHDEVSENISSEKIYDLLKLIIKRLDILEESSNCNGSL